MKKHVPVVSTDAADITKRLHMVEGQLDAIARMIAADEECTAILTQFKAARSGLERAFALFLQANMRRCMGLKDLPAKSREELERITAELVK
jgi:DNA-binding FrmR family transcriptional regulator